MLSIRSHVVVVTTALAGTGFAVFEGKGADDPLSAAPYYVVYGGLVTTDGPSSRPYADADAEVQVTSVGIASNQAEYLADQAFAALVGVALSPPAGRAWLRTGAPVGHVLTRPVERDDDFGAGSPLFYVASIFHLPTTPSS